MGILGTPLGMQHAPVNLQGPINPPGPVNIPAQDEAAHPMGILGTQLGIQHAPANLQRAMNPPGPVNIPAQDEPAHPMGILCTPLGMQHAPANLQGLINPPGPVNIPAQDKAAPPMRILGTPLGMQHAAPADIEGAVAQIAEDPGFEYLGMARRVPRAVSDLSQISEFFRNILYVCFLLTDLGDIDWSAMLGRPRAVHLVWVCNPASGGAQQLNYRLLHWRPQNIHGVGFAELNSYDMRGLSAIIARTVPHNAVRYILGTTGDGRQQLRMHPGFPLSSVDYVLIKSDKDVRAWLLSNPVLEDPLNLMVYCHRPATRETAASPPLRGHNYLPESPIANWARQAGARTGIQAPEREVRPDPGPANAGGNQGYDSPLFLPVPSSSSSDVSDDDEGCEAIIGTSPSAIADPAKSLHCRIPLAIHTLSQMNTNAGLELRGRGGHTPEVKARKRGAPSDSDDLERLN